MWLASLATILCFEPCLAAVKAHMQSVISGSILVNHSLSMKTYAFSEVFVLVPFIFYISTVVGPFCCLSIQQLSNAFIYICKLPPTWGCFSLRSLVHHKAFGDISFQVATFCSRELASTRSELFALLFANSVSAHQCPREFYENKACEETWKCNKALCCFTTGCARDWKMF